MQHPSVVVGVVDERSVLGAVDETVETVADVPVGQASDVPETVGQETVELVGISDLESRFFRLVPDFCFSLRNSSKSNRANLDQDSQTGMEFEEKELAVDAEEDAVEKFDVGSVESFEHHL